MKVEQEPTKPEYLVAFHEELAIYLDFVGCCSIRSPDGGNIFLPVTRRPCRSGFPEGSSRNCNVGCPHWFKSQFSTCFSWHGAEHGRTHTHRQEFFAPAVLFHVLATTTFEAHVSSPSNPKDETSSWTNMAETPTLQGSGRGCSPVSTTRRLGLLF